MTPEQAMAHIRSNYPLLANLPWQFGEVGRGGAMDDILFLPSKTDYGLAVNFRCRLLQGVLAWLNLSAKPDTPPRLNWLPRTGAHGNTTWELPEHEDYCIYPVMRDNQVHWRTLLDDGSGRVFTTLDEAKRAVEFEIHKRRGLTNDPNAS